MLSDLEVDNWKLALEQSLSNNEWVAASTEWFETRSPERIAGLNALLNEYISSAITLKEFQTTFDRKTRKEWPIMGLKGLSGAMFLNTLVKHVPDQADVDRHLRGNLQRPADEQSGLDAMARFIDYVLHLNESGAVTKAQVQAARIPFFLSAWWQIQDREQWPVYYSSMREVFERLGLWWPTNSNLVDDYARFRSVALELGQKLGLNIWEVERLCLYRQQEGTEPVIDVEGPWPSKLEPEGRSIPGSGAIATKEASEHTHAQSLLVELGRKFGLKVWVAQNDQSRVWDGKRLGEGSIASLPTLGIGDAAQNVIRLIDVIWLRGSNQVVAAFEVEYTTAIYSGILRMSDLAVLAPNSNFPFYIVAPESKLSKVRDQLKRPTFQSLDLHERCRYFSIEDLIEHAPAMLRWANTPSAINQIAQHVAFIDHDAEPRIAVEIDSVE